MKALPKRGTIATLAMSGYNGRLLNNTVKVAKAFECVNEVFIALVAMIVGHYIYLFNNGTITINP